MQSRVEGVVVHAVLRGLAPRQQLQAINKPWGCGLHTFGLLYDLGYGPVIFSARIGGFVSVPTCDDLAPSSSSDPCRVGLRDGGTRGTP